MLIHLCIYDFSNINIAVCGSQSRVGTTTTALGLARILSSKGSRVAYIEKSSKLISLLPEVFMCDTSNENFIQYKDIDFALSIPDSIDYNFIVYDYGVGPVPQAIWNKSDCRVLCCCMDVHEVGYTSKMHTELKPDILIGTFVSEIFKDRITDTYNDSKVLFTEYSPDFLFDANINNEAIYIDIANTAIERQANSIQAEGLNDDQLDDEMEL